MVRSSETEGGGSIEQVNDKNKAQSQNTQVDRIYKRSKTLRLVNVTINNGILWLKETPCIVWNPHDSTVCSAHDVAEYLTEKGSTKKKSRL